MALTRATVGKKLTATMYNALLDVVEANGQFDDGATMIPASSSAVQKTLAVSFGMTFENIPEVVVASWVAGSGNVYGAHPEDVTTTGFTIRVSNTAGTSFSGTIGPFRWIARGAYS